MAASTSLACDAVTSNACKVAQVFSDIPFISVGILVFGVSVLFLVLKRVPLSAIFLFLSALLAFFAAVLDSSQILAGGSVTPIPSRIIRTREVCLALSIGFRFLFYWSYVAEPSRRDLSVVATKQVWTIDFPIFEFPQESHSGRWVHWGLPGKFTAAGLLVAIVIVTTLQIVWRVVPQFRQYSNVYATDAALELLVSFLILLELLSNTAALGSVDSMLVHTFSECLLPIFGLLFNMAIGVGDLLRFAFTESMIGRLLQALEVFIIAVSVMVTAFLRHREIFLSTISSQDTDHGDVVFRLPEPVPRSTFTITPPFIETPRMSTVLGAATQDNESKRELPHRSARRSLNHVSSWLSLRISGRRSRQEDDKVKLWDAEKVKGRFTNTKEMDATLHETSTKASKERPRRVYDTSVNHMAVMSASDAQSTIAKFTEGPSLSGQTPRVPRLVIPPRTISLRARTSPAQSSPVSLPEPKYAENMSITPQVSPIYGLTGVQSLASDCGSRMSLDDLLRQQSELDKSIEALRSLSAETSSAILNHKGTQLTRSPSAGQKTVCSEVSLSNFPVPPGPALPTPSFPSTRSSPIQRIRGDRRVLLAAARGQDACVLALKTLATLADIPTSRVNSIPRTPTREENRSLSAEGDESFHSDVGGMRYNVTSFIDGRMFVVQDDSIFNGFEDLAAPGGSRQSRDKPRHTESLYASSTSLPQQPETLRAKPSLTRSPGLLQGNDHASAMHQTAPPLTAPPITMTDGAKTPDMSKALTASQPARNSRSAGGDGRVQKMFVRRRPARLVIESYNLGISQIEPVQVLDDS